MPLPVFPVLPGLIRSGIVLVLLLAAGCDSAEERADRHYRRGLELAAGGDVARAGIEFRNVFRLVPGHSRARLDYARLLRDSGALEEALDEYRRFADADRHHAGGHRELAELALRLGAFDILAEAADRAHRLAPADPLARALKAAADFHRGDRAPALAMAEAVIAEAPEILPAHMIAIAGRMAEGDLEGALEGAEAALALAPEDEELHLARLSVLERAGDTGAMGAALREMAALFPDNAAVTHALVDWHLGRGDAAAAEAVLREAARRTSDRPEAHIAVVRLIDETRGSEAAREELDRLIAEAADPRPFRRARAMLDFASGRSAEALAGIEALAAGSGTPDERRSLEVTLAAMLDETGASDRARSLVAGVLEADPGHVEALKLRARFHLDADRPEAAITDLRTALREAPRDPGIMTLMAAAHEREGAHELAIERLALAAELTSHAPAEALRHARALAARGRIRPAETVLLAALDRAPEHPELLAALGQIHLAHGDSARARATAGILNRLGEREAAAGLEIAALEREGRHEEAAALIERLAAGDPEAAGEAAALPATAPAAAPANVTGRMMAAAIAARRGETGTAEAAYRALVAEFPSHPAPHAALVSLLAKTGRTGEARAALEAGLAATGNHAELRFLAAGLHEAEGDLEAAIAIWEDLYASDPGDPVLANNLASLLAAHRDDAESLERAHRIARRLRDATLPQFQDTYGWILARRGQPEAALAYLEPAAAALATDPLVQYHLAMAYLALDRVEAARDSLARAVALAAGSSLPQITDARARLAALEGKAAADG